jgi:3D (Asp-Asp-Asp) domain-containing protein
MFRISIKKLKMLVLMGLSLTFLFPNSALFDSLGKKIIKKEQIGVSSGRTPATNPNQASDNLLLPLEKQERQLMLVKSTTVTATAYSSTLGQTNGSPFVTASGEQVYDGLIAANWLPFGTKIKIPEIFGDKIFIVNDRMSSRYGYGFIDIWMNAPPNKVKEFGVKKVKIKILQI